jgi:hypothetical protein
VVNRLVRLQDRMSVVRSQNRVKSSSRAFCRSRIAFRSPSFISLPSRSIVLSAGSGNHCAGSSWRFSQALLREDLDASRLSRIAEVSWGVIVSSVQAGQWPQILAGQKPDDKTCVLIRRLNVIMEYKGSTFDPDDLRPDERQRTLWRLPGQDHEERAKSSRTDEQGRYLRKRPSPRLVLP